MQIDSLLASLLCHFKEFTNYKAALKKLIFKYQEGTKRAILECPFLGTTCVVYSQSLINCIGVHNECMITIICALSQVTLTVSYKVNHIIL